MDPAFPSNRSATSGFSVSRRASTRQGKARDPFFTTMSRISYILLSTGFDYKIYIYSGLIQLNLETVILSGNQSNISTD